MFNYETFSQKTIIKLFLNKFVCFLNFIWVRKYLFIINSKKKKYYPSLEPFSYGNDLKTIVVIKPFSNIKKNITFSVLSRYYIVLDYLFDGNS